MSRKNNVFTKTQKILFEYETIKQRILILNDLKAEVEEYKSRGIKSVSYNSIGTMLFTRGDSVGDRVVLVDEMERIVNDNIRREENILHCVEMSLNSLTDIQRKFIEMRYFRSMQMQEIAEELNYSSSGLRNIKNNAISRVATCLFGSAEEICKLADSKTIVQ